jgi:hypothetical protein
VLKLPLLLTWWLLTHPVSSIPASVCQIYYSNYDLLLFRRLVLQGYERKKADFERQRNQRKEWSESWRRDEKAMIITAQSHIDFLVKMEKVYRDNPKTCSQFIDRTVADRLKAEQYLTELYAKIQKRLDAEQKKDEELEREEAEELKKFEEKMKRK